MDPVTLVDPRIEQGKKLIEQLGRGGVPVTAASWVKESDGGTWFLYLVSPIVDTEGIKEGYGHVLAAARKMPDPSGIHPFDVKLISPNDPVARALVELTRQRTAWPAYPNGGSLGGVSIDGVYVYPPAATTAAR